MTGEITLLGRVLPIGGLKEKTMAAYRSGIKTVIIPADNVSDLADIDKTVKESVKFLPVEKIDEVLEAALTRMPEPLPPEPKTSSEVLPNTPAKPAGAASGILQ
jgi:ATP-dependent Lon protease